MIKMRRIACVLAAALMLWLVGCGESEPLPSATDRFFVNDFADVMSDADEQTVYEAGVRLYEKSRAQIVLVTVDTLGGRDLESYALELARAWGIGDEEQNNGVLLLFTTDGPHSRLEIGYGLEGALPDSKAGRILDTYLVPAYDDESLWSTALTATYRGVLNEVYVEYGLTEEVHPMTEYDEQYVELDGGDAIGVIVVFVLLLVLIAVTGRRGGGGLIPIFFGGFHHRGGFGGGGFHSGGFGGGFGGGGFRGGGGGFGGGGASR